MPENDYVRLALATFRSDPSLIKENRRLIGIPLAIRVNVDWFWQIRRKKNFLATHRPSFLYFHQSSPPTVTLHDRTIFLLRIRPVYSSGKVSSRRSFSEYSVSWFPSNVQTSMLPKLWKDVTLGLFNRAPLYTTHRMENKLSYEDRDTSMTLFRLENSFIHLFPLFVHIFGVFAYNLVLFICISCLLVYVSGLFICILLFVITYTIDNTQNTC